MIFVKWGLGMQEFATLLPHHSSTDDDCWFVYKNVILKKSDSKSLGCL